MSVIGSNILAGASGQGGGYNLTNSLRFRSSASAYLNRTPATQGNRRTWTWNAWVKRGSIGTDSVMFSVYADANNFSIIRFSDSNNLRVAFFEGASAVANIETSSLYRDISSWYMITFVLDTTQAVATDRMKLYVNGVQVTSFSSRINPNQNATLDFNNLFGHNIGMRGGNAQYFDGYLTEVNFIDGQALTPSSFGETSTTTGVWQPKRYAGTYGTNGFYLPFTDNSALTTSSNVGLGKDFSGNGNYWTTNNISITSGATYDSMTDVPTLTSATASNFAVLNPLDPAISDLSVTLSNGNLTASGTTYGATVPSATFQVPSTGKWYYETTYTTLSTVALFGIRSYSTGSTDVRYRSDGQKNVGGTNSSYGSSWTTGDVIGVAIDMDAGTVTFYKNNVSQGAISIPTPTATFDLSWNYVTYASTTFNANFGQRPFTYTPPTGFVALNTFNLPTPTIGATASTQANKYMDVTIWTGDNTTPRSISNSGSFQPDFVWLKSRSNAYQHNLYDAVRGAGAAYALSSDSTGAEGGNSSTYGYLSAFNSTGFQVTQGTAGSGAAPNGNAYTNQTSTTYVGWQWKANGTGVTNTAGSITSTVSANTTSGFSVVTYTLNNSTFTVGHGLGVAPKMILVKNRDAGNNWDVYHASLGAGVRLKLNSTDSTNSSTQVWNNTAPTSTVFSGDSAWWTNPSSSRLVAYCFAEVQGYSKFGSYTGNGSTDGTFVFTGFKPKFVMIKRSDSGNNWFILDTSRDTFNLSNDQLLPNSSAAESTGSDCNIDILSNGFKLRTALDASNGSGGTYVYACFAENPYKYSLAR